MSIFWELFLHFEIDFTMGKKKKKKKKTFVKCNKGHSKEYKKVQKLSSNTEKLNEKSLL